jgi:hypothetical protein
VSTFHACQVNCFAGEAHSPYGIEIPFQFDGRDRTMSGYALTGEKQNYEEKIWITVKNDELL